MHYLISSQLNANQRKSKMMLYDKMLQIKCQLMWIVQCDWGGFFSVIDLKDTKQAS